MKIALLQFIFSAAMIYVASLGLTRSCDTIARTTRLGHFLVGGLFLAISTSLPEVFVNLNAARQGLPDLAAGDLLGASIVNLSILSLCVFVFYKKIPDRLQNITASGVLSIALTVFVAIAMLVPQPQLWGVGAASYGIVASYVVGEIFIFKSNVLPAADVALAPPSPRYVLSKAIALFFLASLLLFIMAPILVKSVSALSDILGVSHTFMGSTLMAMTTSSPELLTAVFAARMGLFDLVLGDLVGSNVFNMIIFSFMDVVWKNGSLWEHFSKQHLILAGAGVLNMGLLMGTSWLQSRWGRRWLVVGCILIVFVNISTYILLYFSSNPPL